MVDKEQPRKHSIASDLIFEPEDPPIPTRLFAVNVENGQGIIVQSKEQGIVYSIVDADRDWEPVKLKDEKDVFRAIRMTGMIPIETETGEQVLYSTQAEAVADLRKQFLEVNPLSDMLDIPIERILELAPPHIKEMYYKLLAEANNESSNE